MIYVYIIGASLIGYLLVGFLLTCIWIWHEARRGLRFDPDCDMGEGVFSVVAWPLLLMFMICVGVAWIFKKAWTRVGSTEDTRQEALRARIEEKRALIKDKEETARLQAELATLEAELKKSTEAVLVTYKDLKSISKTTMS